MQMNNKVEELIKKGVKIPSPDSIEIGPEVPIQNISGKGTVIHAGSKIFGKETIIMDDVKIGVESPATIVNCQLGRGVSLGGGFFKESTLLEGVSMGSGAQVREACLLEEYSKGAHCVGLKHTILFPYVTLGSLINFCDIIMAGGTDKKNHSEVGSSYIHFNYTPNQDKATASLIGDVPRGVMLDQEPIFLGGQGGIVGPIMVEYGTVVAAGTILRKDITKPDTIIMGHRTLSKSMPFHRGLFTNIRRIFKMNILYISNLIALKRWYQDVRKGFFKNNTLSQGLFQGALKRIDMAIDERLKRLSEVIQRLPDSISLYQKIYGVTENKSILYKKALYNNWNQIKDRLYEMQSYEGEQDLKGQFLNHIRKIPSDNYISVIKSLKQEQKGAGTKWLKGIVREVQKRLSLEQTG